MKNDRQIIMTVDLEDWFQVENLRGVYPHRVWDSCSLRVGLYTKILLDLFDYYDVHATFFVLGWIAQRCQKLVREIATRGHEVASHGYYHQLSYELSASKVREDLYSSKSLLEDITGNKVLGYRAPSFSINPDTVEALGELGYVYDSSYNNTAFNKRYGRINGDWHQSAAGHMVLANGVYELPVSNLRIERVTIPWGGGGYFRFWPSFLFKWGVTQILQKQGYYLFYFHPWELDSIQPKAKNISLLSRFRHYRNLPGTFHRMNDFLFSFHQCGFHSCILHLDKQRTTNGEDDCKWDGQGLGCRLSPQPPVQMPIAQSPLLT